MLKTFFVLFAASSLVLCRDIEFFECEDGEHDIVSCGYCRKMARRVIGNGSTLLTCTSYPTKYFQYAEWIMISSFDEVDNLGYRTLVVRDFEDKDPYDCVDGQMATAKCGDCKKVRCQFLKNETTKRFEKQVQ